MTLTAAFRAGRVMRWHSNPELAHTNDRIDGHSGRVARIILMLHPNPRVGLLAAALIHDDGEIATGDMSGLVKRANRNVSDVLDKLEGDHRRSIWGDDVATGNAHDRRWLKFADRLDALMWARFHAPQVLSDNGWPEQIKWLTDEATALGCIYAAWAEIMGDG